MNKKSNKAKLDRALRYRDAVRQALMHVWDPIGVSEFLEAEDEYDSYVWPVCSLLIAQGSRKEIADYLHWVETVRMGLTCRRDSLEHVVDRLLQIRKEIDGGDGASAEQP